MMLFYVNSVERSADIQASTLKITNQIGQRTDNCSFTIFQGTKPTENQDIKIYAVASVTSVLGSVVTLNPSYQTNVARFFVGQTIHIRIGTANERTATVTAYNETTRALTLSDVTGISASEYIGVLLFGGVVSEVNDRNVDNINILEWDIAGIDYTKIFDKKLISDTWTDVDSRYIINDFVHRSVNYGQTLDNMSYANNTAIQAEWIESGDGSNPTVDTADFLEGIASAVFLWVFGTGTAAWAGTPTAVDLSAFMGVASGAPTAGELSGWAKTSDFADIASFKIRVGSDASNYAEITISLQNDTDWQYFMSKCVNATVVGTPVWTAVDYVDLVIVQTANGSIRLNGIRVSQDNSFTMHALKSTPLFDDLRSPQLKPTALMNLLAKTWEYVWYIDYERDIHFDAKEALDAPFEITNSSNNFDDLEIDVDASNIGNRVLVRGGEKTSTSRYSQVFQGDGILREWILKNKFNNLEVYTDTNITTSPAEVGTTTTNIKITGHGLSTGDHVVNRTRSNAVRQITKVDNDNFTVEAVTSQTNGDTISFFATAVTLGVEGLTDETTVAYVQNSNEKSVRTTSTTPTLIAGQFIRFEYNERIPIQVQYVDTTSSNALKALGFGDGIFDLDPIIDNNIHDTNTALSFAQAKVAQFANATINGSFTTDQEGLSAGQLLHVAETGRGFDDYFVIQKVVLTQRGGQFKDYFVIKVSFGTSLFGWIEFMQKLLSAKSGIQINNDEIVETFVTSSDEITTDDVSSVALGGFKKATQAEDVTCDDVNTALKNTGWKWEVSTGQTLETRWNLFEWG